MTTTQTGGGNGAAPDGGSGRKLPTRPGWWLGRARAFGGGWGEWEAVRLWKSEPTDSGMWCKEFACWADDASVEWLAPIPGPAVLAALAEYGDAVVQRGPMQARGVSVSGALLALEDAIHVERDGAA